MMIGRLPLTISNLYYTTSVMIYRSSVRGGSSKYAKKEYPVYKCRNCEGSVFCAGGVYHNPII